MEGDLRRDMSQCPTIEMLIERREACARRPGAAATVQSSAARVEAQEQWRCMLEDRTGFVLELLEVELGGREIPLSKDPLTERNLEHGCNYEIVDVISRKHMIRPYDWMKLSTQRDTQTKM
jgi:hypothetical protein